MFTLPSLGLNTLKLISANKVLVASCFLKSLKPCCAVKYPGIKPFGLFARPRGQRLPCGAMRCSAGGEGAAGPGLAVSRPGPAATARGRRCPGGGRPRPGPGAAAHQEVGAWRRLPAGAGLSRPPRCPAGRARWVAERDGARGAHLHPAGGSAQLLRVCLKLRVL